MRTQLELPNDVAAELAGPGDQVMKTLEEHLDCEVYLRGNVLTLDGDDEAVGMGRTVIRERLHDQVPRTGQLGGHLVGKLELRAHYAGTPTSTSP